jgi:allophanate hydrolase subunit 2
VPWDVDVLSPGQFTTIVGAPDVTRLEHGLPTGGPFDPLLAAAANRAAGNADDAPLFECVLVGPRLRFRSAARAAWNERAFDVRAGEEIDIGRFRDTFRGYLAIGGAGGGGRSAVDLSRGERDVIHVMRGPHDVPFADSEWEVTPQLDRVGVRLRPLGAVPPDIPADLPSLGVQFGSVQWHPDGSLVLMGPDHPVTGGYLQPVTVISTERWKLGQLAPGERVFIRVCAAERHHGRKP